MSMPGLAGTTSSPPWPTRSVTSRHDRTAADIDTGLSFTTCSADGLFRCPSSTSRRSPPARRSVTRCRPRSRWPTRVEAPGLQAVLGGRAPQHAGHRQLLTAGAARRDRRAYLDDPGRLRWRDAAEPRTARRGRAVRDARGAASGPGRSRDRSRARHRPAHRVRAAALGRGAERRRVPHPADRPDGVLQRPVADRTPDGAGHRRARARATRRRCGCWDPAATAHRSPGRSACRLPLPTTSARPTRCPRWSSTGRPSGRRRRSREPYAMVCAAVICADSDEAARESRRPAALGLPQAAGRPAVDDAHPGRDRRLPLLPRRARLRGLPAGLPDHRFAQRPYVVASRSCSPAPRPTS